MARPGDALLMLSATAWALAVEGRQRKFAILVLVKESSARGPNKYTYLPGLQCSGGDLIMKAI